MHRQRHALVVAAILATAVLRAHEQDRPLFSAESELVVLHVTVKDRTGVYVTSLTRDSFTVLKDGRTQPVSVFTDTDSPVTVGLLIDGSASMQPNRELVVAAAAAFAQQSNPQDEIFALAFNEDVRAALPENAPFTSDTAVLRNALDRRIRARGRTALYDAISAGLNYVDRGTRERKVLVVVSDGRDNASRATLNAVLTKAQGSNAVIYTIALTDAATGDGNPKILRDIARTTGGEAFSPDRRREVSSVLSHIARDIRHAYTIGYVWTNTLRDGTFRRVEVAVKAPDRRGLVVRSREGYLAGVRGQRS